MSAANVELITNFYRAFQRQDAEAMAACYAADVQFSDAVFVGLKCREAGDMWRMLCSRAKDFSLRFTAVQADEQHGSARWTAQYTFSATGRTVVNEIRAEFVFKDGLIIEHRDHFDLWRWSRQALGLRGLLLGWLPPVQAAIRRQARQGLSGFQAQSRV
ncbi:MAG: nuclear transport factor 2 family protein [Pseudomonadaceae bacterium]|nr:nuclear transport factor 2 family protein [Pseudomonadaceae bacterium]